MFHFDGFLSDATNVPSPMPRSAKLTILQAMLENEGHKVAIRTIQRWADRKRIPTQWVGPVLKAVANTGRRIDLASYYVDPPKPADAGEPKGVKNAPKQ